MVPADQKAPAPTLPVVVVEGFVHRGRRPVLFDCPTTGLSVNGVESYLIVRRQVKQNLLRRLGGW
jgi:hypothetical protein